MLPLKVLGVSRCLIISLLGNLYTIIYILFIHVYIQTVVLAIVVCFQHSKWMPMNAD
jgi:hypothetical protein